MLMFQNIYLFHNVFPASPQHKNTCIHLLHQHNERHSGMGRLRIR